MGKIVRIERIGCLGIGEGYYPFLYSGRPNGAKIIDNRCDKPIGAPLFLDVYPSMECNFNCKFCYNKLFGIASKSSSMSKKTINEIIKLCSKSGIPKINILGGEPLHPNIRRQVYYLAEKCREKEIKTDITTNGSFLGKKIVNFCNKNKVDLNVSFHAVNEVTASKIAGVKKYDIKKNILEYLDGKTEYGISVAVLKDNYKEFDEIFDFINGLQCRNMVLRYPTMRQEESVPLNEFFALYEKYRKKCNKKIILDAPFAYRFLNAKPPENKLDFLYAGCKAGLLKAEILPDGDVFSCILFANRKDQRIGNVNESVDFKKEYINKLELKFSNSSCVYSSFCTGCPAYAELQGLAFDNRCGGCDEKNKSERDCSV